MKRCWCRVRSRLRRLGAASALPESPHPHPSTPSWSALFHGRHLAYTILLTLGVGVHAIGIHLVATVLPSVVVDLGGASFYTWATMLYTIASIIGTACGGPLKVRLSLRRGYLLGVLVELVAWVGCALAPHIAVLLVARAVQGFGSGLLVSLAYSMVSEFYAEVLRARVLAVISGIWGVAALLGPIVGGVFASSGWWRGAFWVGVPSIVALGLIAWQALPRTGASGEPGALPGLRLTLLALGVLGVAGSGLITPVPWRLLLLGSAAGVVWYAFQLDHQAGVRLFPTQPLSLKTLVGTASWLFFLFGTTTSTVTVFMPLFLHILHGVSLLTAGYINALLSLTWTVVALGSAGLSPRQVRRAVWIGPLLVLVGTIGLKACIVPGPLLLIGACMALIGAGIGLCYAHISSWNMAAAQPGEETQTASAIPTIHSLGIAFGAAGAGLVANVGGLGMGIDTEAVALATNEVYRLSVIPPAIMTVLAARFVWLHGVHHSRHPRVSEAEG